MSPIERLIHFMLDRGRKSFLEQSVESLRFEDELKWIVVLLQNEGIEAAADLIDSGRPILNNNGRVFQRSSNVVVNERRYGDILDLIFALNKYNVAQCEVEKFDVELNRILDLEEADPLWHELDTKQAKEGHLPAFNISRLTYRAARFESIVRTRDTGEKSMNKFQNIERDRKIPLRDDFDTREAKETNLMQYLQNRIQKEQNPYYTGHPYISLLLLLIGLKSILKDSYFSVGIRYLELVILRQSGTGLRTLPFVFNSEGNFLGIEGHSHSLIRFRLILNILAGLFYNHETHQFDDEYLNVSNEILLYYLRHPDGGLVFKKAFSGINLYYGLKPGRHVNKQGQNAKKTPKHFDHMHPLYSLPPNFGSKPLLVLEYSESTTCTACAITKSDELLYKNKASPLIEASIKKLTELELPLLVQYVRRKLLYIRPSEKIIHDLVFVKMHINAGGYSRTNQIVDFEPITEMLKRNEKYRHSQDYIRSMHTLGRDIEEIAYSLTLRMIDEGRYPSSVDFHRNIQKYITTKSAGLGTLKVEVETTDGRKYSQTSTSKQGYISMCGAAALDITNVKPSVTLCELIKNTTDMELRQKIIDGTLTDQELFIMAGISKIGSRAVSAFRPIRPIYINPLAIHLGQAAVIGPHVMEGSNRPVLSENGSMHIGNGSLGACIATQFMDGSLDIVAPAVMASGSGDFILIQSDSSNFDQTSVFEFLNIYLKGVLKAFKERSVSEDMKYLYNGNQGMNVYEIINWLLDVQSYRYFVVEYCGERLLFRIDYMVSGRLDTFYGNSIKNGCIHKQFLNAIQHKHKSLELSWYQVAGDDGTVVMRMHDSLTEDMIKSIEDTIVSSYTEANHIINKDKTLISSRSGEYAKIYWYYGMVFRDPSIQLLESETESHADTRIDQIRGAAQKMFEYTRRSVGNIHYQAVMNRLLTYNTMSLRHELREGNTRRQYRIALPPQLLVVPTTFKGGIGMSISGLCQNEILLLRYQFFEYIRPVLHMADKITFESIQKLNDAIFDDVLSDGNVPVEVVKSFKQGGSGPSIRVKRVKYSSNDGMVQNMNFKRGLQYMEMHLNKEKELRSKTANDELKRRGIHVNDTVGYRWSHIRTFMTTLQSMRRPRELDRRAVAYIMEAVTSPVATTSNREVFLAKFDIHKAFNFTLLAVDSQKHRHDHIRYATSPHEIRHLERIIGTRVGKTTTKSMQGSNRALSKFIARHAIPLTESSIFEIIKDVLTTQRIKGTSSVRIIEKVLTFISGDDRDVTQVAESLIKDMEHWEDLVVSTGIQGTHLENLDMSYNNIKRFIHFGGGIMPAGLKKLISYMAFNYLISMNLISNFRFGGVLVTPNLNTEELIKHISLFNTIQQYGAETQHPLLRYRNLLQRSTTNEASVNVDDNLLDVNIL